MLTSPRSGILSPALKIPLFLPCVKQMPQLHPLILLPGILSLRQDTVKLSHIALDMELALKVRSPILPHGFELSSSTTVFESTMANNGSTKPTAHEPPYLHQGNRDTEIEEGMVMTLEPGVYLKDFGVRTEDVVMVVGGEGEDLIVEVLSGQRASGPWDP